MKRLNHNALDFYGTLVDVGEVIWELANCSNSRYENIEVYKDDEIGFGVKRCDYYTLATDEAKGLRWSDGSSAEGTPIMCEEEDTEEPEVQHINDQFSFARSKNYDIQEYIQVGNNLNIAKNMKEGCTMPTIKYTREDITKLENERDQYKLQRDELIKDVAKLRELKDQLIFENRYLEEQVKSLRNKYTNLTEHIRLKALHNPSVSRYKDLMHFIDELEGDTHEG